MDQPEPHISLLIAAADECEKAWQLTGFCQLTVKGSDGKFRKAKFGPDGEFFFKGAYEGKRDGTIFVFVPVEPLAECQQVEIPEKKVFGLIGGFQGFIQLVMDAEGVSYTIRKAQLVGMAKVEARAAAAAAAKEAELAALDAAKKAADLYANDPLFGAF